MKMLKELCDRCNQITSFHEVGTDRKGLEVWECEMKGCGHRLHCRTEIIRIDPEERIMIEDSDGRGGYPR